MRSTHKSMLFESIIVLLLIFSIFILYYAIVNQPDNEQWTLSGIIAPPFYQDFIYIEGVYGNMFTGEEGVLYTVDGANIHAIDSNGHILWTLDIPDVYKIRKNDRTFNVTVSPTEKWNGIDAVTYNSDLYIILKPCDQYDINAVLLAISSEGKVKWNVSFISSREVPYRCLNGFGNPESIFIDNGTIYAYSKNYGLTAISLNGSIIRLFEDMESRPFFDDEGIIYTRGVLKPVNVSYSWNWTQINDNRTIDAYYPNGTLKWRQVYKKLHIDQFSLPVSLIDASPTYHDGTIYVWSDDGMVALDKEGNVKWEQRLKGLYLYGCGINPDGTIYLSFREKIPAWPYTFPSDTLVVSPEGRVIAKNDMRNTTFSMYGLHYLDDEVYYDYTAIMPFGNDTSRFDINNSITYIDGTVILYLKEHNGKWDFPRGIDDLDTVDIRAWDLNTGEIRWSYRIPLNPRSITLTGNTARLVTMEVPFIEKYNIQSPGEWYENAGIPAGSKGIKSFLWTNVLTGNDTIYVNMWSYNYEVPAFYYKSRCVYSGGIYALDKNGDLLWSVPTDTRIISMHEMNDTFYYGTGSGKISAVKSELFTGILLTAAAYIFFRFFAVGVVARARARVDKNENRNTVLEYIKKNPGSSLYEVSQGLGMNMGTVRYHLLVLGLNRRIVSFKADEKYIRYFLNSNSYNTEQQYIISLMRREPLRKILNLLLEKPGLSNLEISRELGAGESSTIRSMKELTSKGIVSKEVMQRGKIVYNINDSYKEYASCALKVVIGK